MKRNCESCVGAAGRPCGAPPPGVDPPLRGIPPAPTVLCFGLLIAAGCGPSIQAVTHGHVPVSASGQVLSANEVANEIYHLRSGDELDISIWGRENLNKRIPIREDGTFLFPPVGLIKAEGRSLREVEQQIQERLSQSVPLTPEQESPTEPSAPGRVLSTREIPNEVYHLRVGDELDISVWNQPDLNKKALIREDGTFSFPLVGSIQGAGRALQEVEKEVQERLDKDYLVNPQVTVQLSGAKFSVLGEVERPGWYEMAGTVDLLTALSQAGGLTKFGSNQVEVIRGSGKEKVTIQAHVDQIFKGTEPNMMLSPRDTIYVRGNPAETMQVTVRLYGAKFSVLGDVERPGAYLMEGPVDLLTALSQAGGITKFGSNHVEIIRGDQQKKMSIRIHMDRVIVGKEPNVAILPHDTIYVRRRLF
ncbi:MAG: polysaccharide biosynthesis/export family protein [Candidatus Omnitrophica bacterium]|nr:polysaccharide biosynthesis/export family protein [Candidatus Omnitrophota bacterium]